MKIFRVLLYCAASTAVSVSILFVHCTDSDEHCASRAPVSMKTAGRIILTIGDSNGVVNGGWPAQLAVICASDTVINNSESGRTIGFDNSGKKQWNALRNIDGYLSGALTKTVGSPIDEVVIMLGTNDTKACFADRQDAVPRNLAALVQKIRSFNNGDSTAPHITIVSPPPYAHDDQSPDKARGAHIRVRSLAAAFRNVALNMGCGFVNMHQVIEPVFSRVAVDHVHLSRQGHAIVARAIASVLNDRTKPLPPWDIQVEGAEMNWRPSPSSDVLGYEIIQDGRVAASTSALHAVRKGLSEQTGVRARDMYGNVSDLVYGRRVGQ